MINKILPLILIFSLLNPTFAGEDGALGAAGRTLTDEERNQANTYNHAGRTNRQIEESCANYNGYDDLCSNNQTAFKEDAMQTVETMIPVISQAWGMFSGLSGGGGGLEWPKNNSTSSSSSSASSSTSTSQSGDSASSQSEASEEETEQGEDYCQYIPMVGELAATVTGTLQAGNTAEQYEATDPNHRQTASLRAVKKAHEDRSIVAGVQSGVWGATGVCYTAMLIAGAVPNFSTIAKVGAAYLLTTFFIFKTVAHLERAKLVQEIIDSLPKQGECNPHTDTLCFCDEPTSFQFDSQNFTKYCLPHALASRGVEHPFVCVDANNQPDPACNCRASGSCADKRLKLASVNLGLNPAIMKDAFSSLLPITSGTAGGDLLANSRRNQAMMKQTLDKYKPVGNPNIRLSPEQKNLAKEFANLGVPATVAAYMASKANNAKIPPSIRGGNLANGNDKLRKIMKDSESGLQFNKNRISSRGSSNKKRGAFNPFAKKGAKAANNSAIENLDQYFADKATQAAQINNDPGKNIFDIVTYRYKMSAWKRFENQITQEMKPEASDKRPASTP